jgi:hypothetical protein
MNLLFCSFLREIDGDGSLKTKEEEEGGTGSERRRRNEEWKRKLSCFPNP